jgi:hypothetical protein
VRGLAAACKLQGRYEEAIGYYKRVLLISQAMGEFTGRVHCQACLRVLGFACSQKVYGGNLQAAGALRRGDWLL